MKSTTTYIVLALAIFLGACGANPEVSTDLVNIPGSASGEVSDKIPVMTFKESLLDFGSVAEGEVIEHLFTFENTGNAPLILTTIETTCGCTVAKNWTKEPIAPGDRGSFSVEFDTNRRPGFQNKTITVLANTAPARNEVKIQGTVMGPNTQTDNP